MLKQTLISSLVAFSLAQVAAPAGAQEAVSPGGSTIYNHGPTKEFRPTENFPRHYDEITAHLESFLGDDYFVLHELVSDKVHLDVLIFPPSQDRQTWVLVTCGMSDLPMSVPAGIEDREAYEHSEMVITLPGDWFTQTGDGQIPEAQMREEKTYWPVRQIKSLGRLPHDYETWLYYWHTIPNGNPALPFADNTGFTGVMLLPPLSWPPEKEAIQTGSGVKISFLGVYPLYEEEMDIKLQYGADKLIDLFEKAGVSDLVEIARVNTAKFLTEGSVTE
ncbi:hypothetical protein IWQ52_001189 [Labrenzia sp. EL_159]|nr:hypothetical protein [Labrenzia sp. EL_162]MBG6193687.1 hypothetical protein [Labrenzia sp. EL_159]